MLQAPHQTRQVSRPMRIALLDTNDAWPTLMPRGQRMWLGIRRSRLSCGGMQRTQKTLRLDALRSLISRRFPVLRNSLNPVGSKDRPHITLVMRPVDCGRRKTRLTIQHRVQMHHPASKKAASKPSRLAGNNNDIFGLIRVNDLAQPCPSIDRSEICRVRAIAVVQRSANPQLRPEGL